MEKRDIYLTQENLKTLEQELQALEGPIRKQAIEELKAARGHGDLSENFEYTAAREELKKISRKIAEIKGILAFAKTITDVSTDSVDIGTCFVATSIRNGVLDTKTYELVGYADLKRIVESIKDSSKPSPITVDSPFGRAIRDKKAGDVYVYVDAENNKVSGQIVSIVSELEVKKVDEKPLVR